MIRQAYLLGWANPYHALDHFGRPAGACPKERTGSTLGHAGYVGAECVASAPVPVEPGSAGTPDQDTCWHFSKEPVKLPDTGYYRLCLRQGAIFPADEKTAKTCTTEDAKLVYEPLDAAVGKSKAAAFAKWKAAFAENPEEVDPYARPRPNGQESPADVAAKSGEQRVAQSKATQATATAPDAPKALSTKKE
jgi:hypothetical protein